MIPKNIQVSEISKRNLIALKLARNYNQKLFPKIENRRGAYFIRRILNKPFQNLELVTAEILDTSILGPSDSTQFLNLFTGYDPGEKKQLEFILNNVEEGDIFVDIGAAYGLFSQVIENKTAADCYSFEPLPSNVKLQKINNTLFDRNVNIKEKACGQEECVKDLYISEGNIGWGKFSHEDRRNSIDVDVVKLEDEFRKIDHMKIDVEGHELRVLKGAEGVLDGVKSMLIEVHPQELRKRDESIEELKNFLEDHSFNIERNQNYIECKR